MLQSDPLAIHVLYGSDTLYPPNPHVRRLLARHTPDHAYGIDPEDLLLAWRPLRHISACPSFPHDRGTDDIAQSSIGQPTTVEG